MDVDARILFDDLYEKGGKNEENAFFEFEDATIKIYNGLNDLGFSTSWNGGEILADSFRVFVTIHGKSGKAEVLFSGQPSGDGGLDNDCGLYAGIYKGAEWWKYDFLDHGEVECSGNEIDKFVEKVLDVWNKAGHG